MPQAVQSGALTPATPIAAMGVIRLWPSVSRPQNVSGASAVGGEPAQEAGECGDVSGSE